MNLYFWTVCGLVTLAFTLTSVQGYSHGGEEAYDPEEIGTGGQEGELLGNGESKDGEGTEEEGVEPHNESPRLLDLRMPSAAPMQVRMQRNIHNVHHRVLYRPISQKEHVEQKNGTLEFSSVCDIH